MTADPSTFARSWIEAWNAHDLDAVLDHFSDDVVFSSPLVASIVGEPSGSVTGKAALRAYWEEGLRRIPDLRFELVEVYAGVDSIAITYRNQGGRSCCETVVLGPDGRAARGWALYGS